MQNSSYYREQADHARRLAAMTVQQNLEELLHRVADELDGLAHDVASSEADFGDLGENSFDWFGVISVSGAWAATRLAWSGGLRWDTTLC